MKQTTDTRLTNLIRTFIPGRKWLLAAALILLVCAPACIPGCEEFKFNLEDETPGQVAANTGAVHGAYIAIDNDLANTLTVFCGQRLSPPPPYPTHQVLKWTPPSDLKNIQFVDGPPPEPGGPPFVWNLPVDPVTGRTPTIKITHDPPATRGVSLFEAPSSDKQINDYKMVHHKPPSVSADVASLPTWGRDERPGADPERAAAVQNDYYLWRNAVIADAKDTTMTTDLCQDGTDLLQQGTSFVALRFPVYPTTLAYTDPYTPPIVFAGAYSPTLILKSGTSPIIQHITIPLEYKPRYFTFVENELPSAPGEHWLALGAVSTPTFTCPQGLNIPGGDWRLETSFYLDFGGVKDTCANCVLPYYLCYEGQDLPSTLMGQALGADVTSYQGWGITCAGPYALRLTYREPRFNLGLSHAAHVTPTHTISFTHYVQHEGTGSMTLSLDYTTTLDLPWGFYSGTEDAPDWPLVPLPDPLTLGSWERRYFWVIGENPVPAGTPSGMETLRLIATDVASPTLPVWTTDVLWVGDWVAPPPPPGQHRLYLPLVLRQSP